MKVIARVCECWKPDSEQSYSKSFEGCSFHPQRGFGAADVLILTLTKI